MEYVLRFMSIWAVIGFFLALVYKNPKTKRDALDLLIISGPLCWVIFIIVTITGSYKD